MPVRISESRSLRRGPGIVKGLLDSDGLHILEDGKATIAALKECQPAGAKFQYGVVFLSFCYPGFRSIETVMPVRMSESRLYCKSQLVVRMALSAVRTRRGFCFSERQALRVTSAFFAIFHLFLGLDFTTEAVLPGWQQARQRNIWI